MTLGNIRVAMPEDLISVIDLAAQMCKRKTTIFKVLRRLGIDATKMRSSANAGQLISYITDEEAKLVVEELSTGGSPEALDEEQPSEVRPEQGVFYLLLLEPDHDPGRFKVGFAVSLPERLRQLRCSAPFARVVRSWPCKSLWEKTAIECASVGCERLHTEVFRTSALEKVVERCDQFFSLMPSLVKLGDASSADNVAQPSVAADAPQAARR
jgi:hypothetical protein